MVIYEEIKIEGAFSLKILQEFELHIIPNTHAKAVIKGIFENVDELEKWQKTGEKHKIQIYQQSDDTPIFFGEVSSAWWIYESGLYTGELSLVSSSVELDNKKESASFQNISLTYEEILEKSFSTVQGAICNCTAIPKAGPHMPLIQYMETDWEFAIRMASHLNTVIYPEVQVQSPYVWIGIPDRGDIKVKPEAEEYIHGISSKYYELGGSMAGLEKGHFEYYQIESSISYPVGVVAEYMKKAWIIIEKHAKLKRGEICYTYVLGQKMLTTVKKSYNPLFAGMSILGTVINTEDENVKLHLEIDDTQSVDTAYPYKWVPDTGSVMYCMPETGSTVSLYFANEDETSAMAVSCVRHNGNICPDMERRTLTTNYGKCMYMNPDAVGFAIKESEHTVMLEDKKGISLGSSKKISIQAAEGIKLKADRVIMTAPQEINIMRGQMIKVK